MAIQQINEWKNTSFNYMWKMWPKKFQLHYQLITIIFKSFQIPKVQLFPPQKKNIFIVEHFL